MIKRSKKKNYFVAPLGTAENIEHSGALFLQPPGGVMCVTCACRTLRRYFGVHFASPANELSRERGDQTQGAAQEAAGCLLRQVRSLAFRFSSARIHETQRLLFCLSVCAAAGTPWPTVAGPASARPPMTRAASRWTTGFCTQSNVSVALRRRCTVNITPWFLTRMRR